MLSQIVAWYPTEFSQPAHVRDLPVAGTLQGPLTYLRYGLTLKSRQATGICGCTFRPHSMAGPSQHISPVHGYSTSLAMSAVAPAGFHARRARAGSRINKQQAADAFPLALLPAQQSGAHFIQARMRAALADLDQGEFTEGGVACVSNLVPKSATSDGDNAKGPALPVAVFGEIPWQ
jgi:hypothetical protein